ncbi:cytochrome c1 [Candidatus Paracaedibacter symbiosus]|uniref:cytochrome c1 n=1 Tax=Candidatus Paracaedibacter symbiosus TaxID=244582 RepID=UPI000509EAA7|nr:cytochrome c1 [Candidatus Paracaedibacter symbiosus]
MKKLIALLLTGFLGTVATEAIAESDTRHPKKVNWPFAGPLGKFPIDALQRGFLVYKQVCAACHGLDHLRYGNLAGQGKDIETIRTTNLGLTMEEAKAIAAEYTVKDLDDEGQPADRKALPSDYFANPYPNEKASRAANNGAHPPDLSLVVKARPGGASYVYSLLTGYEEAPKDVTVGPGRYYNPYFPGGQLSMTAPLTTDGQVTYPDGTPATVDQMAKDVVTFLAWASDPHAEERKQTGVKVMFYLLIMTAVFYLAKRRIWKNVKH